MDPWDTFVESVGREFRFLETEFGFVLKSTKLPFMIFESDKVRVNIFYDYLNNCELDLGIRRIGDDIRKTSPVDLTEMMTFSGDRDAAANYKFPFPSTVESVEIEVRGLGTSQKIRPTSFKGREAYF